MRTTTTKTNRTARRAMAVLLAAWCAVGVVALPPKPVPLNKVPDTSCGRTI